MRTIIINHQCHNWRTLPTSHELDAAAEHAPHVRAGDLHDVDGGRGQHEAQPQAGQEPAEVDDSCGGREEDGEEARCVGGAGDHEERDPAAEPLHAEPRQQTAHQAADRQHARCNATTIHIYFLFTVQYCSLLFSSLELSNFDIDVLSNKHLNRALVCEYQCPY